MRRSWSDRLAIAVMVALITATAYVLILIACLAAAPAYTLSQHMAELTARNEVGFPLAVNRGLASPFQNVETDARATCVRRSRLAFRCEVTVAVYGWERCLARPLVRARRNLDYTAVTVFVRWRTAPVCDEAPERPEVISGT